MFLVGRLGLCVGAVVSCLFRVVLLALALLLLFAPFRGVLGLIVCLSVPFGGGSAAVVFFDGLLGGPLGEVLVADLGEPVRDYLCEAPAVAFGVVVLLVGGRGSPLC